VIRLAKFLFVAILAMGLTAAPIASAGSYLFATASIGTSFLGVGLVSLLRFGKNELTCTDDHSEGRIDSVHLLGPFDITFLGCKVSTNEGREFCTIKSVGAAEGVILTHTLHALLGLVLPSGLGGLLLLPTSSDKWFTAASTKCSVEAVGEGVLAGLLEASQSGHLVLESLVNFIPGAITLIDTLNGRVEPELELFSLPGTYEAVEHLEWDGEIEVELP
jgi:hypothetical protein